ncbi:MAG: hypothetical protein CMJ78_07520 [Planctomycetaceae bacterium]|nr:hypothetical protein [Planctomycetaceae bacterium]
MPHPLTTGVVGSLLGAKALGLIEDAVKWHVKKHLGALKSTLARLLTRPKQGLWARAGPIIRHPAKDNPPAPDFTSGVLAFLHHRKVVYRREIPLR